MRRARIFFLPLFFCLIAGLWAQSASGAAASGASATQPPENAPIFPLADVKPGMHGVGWTVFEGDKPAPFTVEILGVVNNMGPREAVVLARLTGGPLADTGVMEGMSGSPVYIDGKLLGAVALGFAFAKDAICGITPFASMLAQETRAQAVVAAESKEPVPFSATDTGWKILTPPPGLSTAVTSHAGDGNLPPPDAPDTPDANTLPELHTPIVFSGFSNAAIDQFLPQWRAMGLSPTVGGGMSAPGGGVESLAAMHKLGAPGDLEPGDMISVQLLRGDLGVAADGTVTAIRDGEVFAFGHRFLSTGDTAMPFARSHVVALVAGLQSSFKLSEADLSMGVIRQDLSEGVYGELGTQPAMIPIRIHVHSPGQPVEDYVCEMVHHRFLSPLLLNMALYSTLDATERAVGAQTLDIQGTYRLAGGDSIHAGDLYSGDMNGPAVAAATATRALSMLYGSGLDGIQVAGIDFDVSSSDQERVLHVEQVWSDKREVMPGEKIEVTTVLRADDGTEVERDIPLQLPESLPDGPLTIISGAGTAVGSDGVSPMQLAASAHDLTQLVAGINQLPRNDELYLRVTRADPGYVLGGEQFPFPPPSLARALAADPAVDADVHSMQSSTVLDYHSDPLPYVIEGSKTIRLTVHRP